MYFTVNTVFVNHLDNLTESLKFPILPNTTTHEQTLPMLPCDCIEYYVIATLQPWAQSIPYYHISPYCGL